MHSNFLAPTPVLLVLCLLVTPAHADNVAWLDQIVVTGTRTERSVIDAPVRTEVVTRQELERTHARSLKEALENVSGLQLREIHGKAGYEVSLQGLSGEQVLVLVDGLRISASTGSTVDVSQLALTEVERIEIVKGATSAQYGSAAMGGVINVITRDVTPGFSGEMQGDIGSYGSQNPSTHRIDIARRHARARVDTGTETLRLRLAADRLESDGITPVPGGWARPSDEVDRQQYDARLEWHPSPDGRFYLQGGRFTEDGISRASERLPGGVLLNTSKTEAVIRDRYVAGGRWAWPGGFAVQLNGVHEQFSDDTLKYSPTGPFDDRYAEMDLSQLSLQVDSPYYDGMDGALGYSFQMGGDLHHESLRQTKDGVSELDGTDRVSRRSDEIFRQDTFFYGDALELVLGVRHQYDSDFGSHVAGNAGARWHLWRGSDWRTTARLGWGQGYRVPNLKERFYLFDHSQLGYVVIGNPDLQPERSQSWQLGTTFSWREQWVLELGVFHNALRNLIQIDADTDPVPGGTVQEYQYDNVARAMTRGAEVGLDWAIAPRLSLHLNHTHMQTEDRDSGQRLTRRPRDISRAGINMGVTETTELTLRGRYQSDELATSAGARSPAWRALDISLTHQATPALSVLAGVDNLFDTQRDFADPADFSPIVGRFIYLGARYQFGQR
ncbi:TonB-dependent receptor plug domain-containing protein [Isoalcanivorax indicus]|uniref:TonB-dependent receptor plug domain-containing protein n=1 Tax=Isoalcanivorax indicus TaxID=2202653 RepID=UPI000DBAAE73|nr:TonB-dependent receptor [Isoalcanivorax indicus]